MTRIAVWGGGALIGFAALLLFGIGAYNPNPARWAALALLAFYVMCASRFRIPRDEISCGVYVFIAYAAASLLWSPDWREGVIRLHSIFVLSVLFIALLHGDRKFLGRFIPVAATVAICVQFAICLVFPTIYGGLGNENFQSEFLVLAAPLALLGVFTLRFGIVCGAVAAAAMAQAVFLNGSHAELAAFAGLAVFAVACLVVMRRYWFAVAAVLSVALLCALSWDASLNESLESRVQYVGATLRMWADYPASGAGLGGFNYLFPKYGEIADITRFIGAAHNEYAQALAVFGLAGVMPLLWIAWHCLKPSEWDATRLAGAACVFMAAGLALVGFPMQNPPTAVLSLTGLALAARRPETEPLVIPRYAIAVVLAVFISVGTLNWKTVKAERHFSQAEAWAATDPLQTFGAVHAAMRELPLDSRYRMQYVVSLESLARSGRKVNLEPSAADRIYEYSKSASPYHPGVMVARASYLLNSGRWKDSDEIAGLVETLKRNSPNAKETWWVAVHYAARRNDRHAAVAELMEGLRAGVSMNRMQQIARSVKMEIVKNDTQ